MKPAKPKKPSQAEQNLKAWQLIYSQIPEWKRFKPARREGKPPIPPGIQPSEAPDLWEF